MSQLFPRRLHWQESSVAFWPNRCVQYHATPAYWPHTRSAKDTAAADRPY